MDTALLNVIITFQKNTVKVDIIQTWHLLSDGAGKHPP